MIDCYRHLQDSDHCPFITPLSNLTLCVQAHSNGQECGVNFCTCADNISPHIRETHCESSLHVYNPPKGLTLQAVLTSRPEYNNIGGLMGLHIKVEATKCKDLLSDVVVSRRVEDGSYEIRFQDTDKYYLYSSVDEGIAPDIFMTDRFVSRNQIERAIIMEKDNYASHGHAPSIEVLLIDILDEEGTMSNWAYLSTDAMRFIVDEGVQVVVVNTPSVDREVDGGCVSNHKAVFERPEGLVVELAQLSRLQRCGYGRVSLQITPHPTYLDCGPCHLSFEFL